LGRYRPPLLADRPDKPQYLSSIPLTEVLLLMYLVSAVAVAAAAGAEIEIAETAGFDRYGTSPHLPIKYHSLQSPYPGNPTVDLFCHPPFSPIPVARDRVISWLGWIYRSTFGI